MDYIIHSFPTSGKSHTLSLSLSLRIQKKMIFQAFFLGIFLMSGCAANSIQEYYACVSTLLRLDLGMRQIQHHCARQVGGIIRNGRFFPFHSRARSTTEPKTTTTTMTTTKTTTATTTATMTATTLTMTTTTMTTTTIPKPTKFDYSPWTIDLQSVPFESMFSLNIFGFFFWLLHI